MRIIWGYLVVLFKVNLAVRIESHWLVLKLVGSNRLVCCVYVFSIRVTLDKGCQEIAVTLIGIELQNSLVVVSIRVFCVKGGLLDKVCQGSSLVCAYLGVRCCY